MINFSLRVDSLANEAVSGSGGDSDVLDINNFTTANLFVNVSARSGGTNTMSIAVQHSEDGSTGWDTVPASSLFNPATGDTDTFDDVSASATDQTLALNTQQLRRFVRVVYTGSTLTHNVAVTAVGQPAYTEIS